MRALIAGNTVWLLGHGDLPIAQAYVTRKCITIGSVLRKLR